MEVISNVPLRIDMGVAAEATARIDDDRKEGRACIWDVSGAEMILWG